MTVDQQLHFTLASWKKYRFLRRLLCKQLFPFFSQLGNTAFEVLDKLPDGSFIRSPFSSRS